MGVTKLSIGYRAVLHLPSGSNAVEAVEKEFRIWVEQKGYPQGLDFEKPFMVRKSDTDSIAVSALSNGAETAKSFVLLETNSDRLWKVSLYALAGHTASEGGLILIEVDVSHSDGENPVDLIEPPRIARNLLKTYSATDGAIPLTPSATYLSSENEVSQLLHEIENPDRRATINVAPSPGATFDAAWKELLDNLVKRGTGNASTYILADELISKFNSLIGVASFGAAPGTVRSYVPGFDPADPSSRSKHRYVSTSGLQKSIQNRSGRWVASPHLQKAFNVNTRLRFIQTEIPLAIRASVAALDEATERLRKTEKRQDKLRQASLPNISETEPRRQEENSAVADSNSAVPHVHALQRFKRLVKRILGIEEITVEAIQELETVFARNQADLEASEELLQEAEAEKRLSLSASNQLRESNSDARESLEQERRRVRQLEYENRMLRKSFGKDTQIDESALFETDPPQLMEELINRLTDAGDSKYAWLRNNVGFTGSEDPAMQLDSQADAHIYVDATWDRIAVLYDYVESKKSPRPFSGDVESYLRSPSEHTGKTTGLPNHSPNESSQVKANPKYRKPRTLPVPTSVRPDGYVEMWAHFRIDTSNTVAPRLHYYDDTANTGKVYVGYIGRHLPSPKTN
jgi:hypothetical protein